MMTIEEEIDRGTADVLGRDMRAEIVPPTEGDDGVAIATIETGEMIPVIGPTGATRIILLIHMRALDRMITEI